MPFSLRRRKFFALLNALFAAALCFSSATLVEDGCGGQEWVEYPASGTTATLTAASSGGSIGIRVRDNSMVTLSGGGFFGLDDGSYQYSGMIEIGAGGTLVFRQKATQRLLGAISGAGSLNMASGSGVADVGAQAD
ncbi:MAG: hypothetical protein LBE84_03550, partial [Planctomycetota bacterium]|nr:hypothetical protein [Planctomycetota bacterium]